MKPSRRNPPAMFWCLAASAILAPIAGLGAGSPAAADPGPEPDRGTAQDSRGDSRPPAKPGRVADRGPTGSPRPPANGRGGGTGTEAGGDPDPRPEDCHRWPYWPPLWPPVDDDTGRGNAFFLAVAAGLAPAPVVPPTWVAPAAARVDPPDATGPPDPEEPPASGGGATTRLAAGAGGAPRGGPMMPSPPPVPPPPPAAPPPPVPPPPAPPPFPSAAPAVRSALTEAALDALPGVVGLFALTGAGGLLGYRQARAGFALRAAGTARFLP